MLTESGEVQRRPSRRAGQSRPDILAAASDVIGERGYASTRFSDIAARAGTSVSTLQYLFGNREDLMGQAVEWRAEKYLADARTRCEAIADPVDRLRWLTNHLAAADEPDDEAARRNWLVWLEFSYTALRDNHLHESAVGVYQGWAQLYRDALEYAVAQGAIAEPDDVEAISQGACALADGFGIQIAIGHPQVSWQYAGGVVRLWLASVLSLPALAAE
jgi:AcrR family transcriptional regulator